MFEKLDNDIEQKDLLFKFDYTLETKTLTLNSICNALCQIKIELKLPCGLSVDEDFTNENRENEHSQKQTNSSKTANLLIKHYLMSSLDLKKELLNFIKSLNQNYYDTLIKNALNSQKDGLISKNDLKIYWNTINSRGHRTTNEAVSKMEETIQNGSINYEETGMEKKRTATSSSMSSSSPIFAKMYHSLLIHSHQLMSMILKRERYFMLELNGLIMERDRHLKMIQDISTGNDNESMSLEKNKWKLRIDGLKNMQQRKFRKYISKLYECKENEQISNNLGTSKILIIHLILII